MLALELTVSLRVDFPEPGAPMDVGVKLAVTPDGSPLADKATAESKPPETAVVIVELPELRLDTVSEVGDALMVKLALAGAVTVRVTVDVCVTPPPVPVTVIVYVPAVVVEATAIVMVEVPVPVMDVELKVTATPVGWPLADKATAASKPFTTVEVIVEVP